MKIISIISYNSSVLLLYCMIYALYSAYIYTYDSSGQATATAATLSLRSSGLDLQNVPMYQLTVQVGCEL